MQFQVLAQRGQAANRGLPGDQDEGLECRFETVLGLDHLCLGAVEARLGFLHVGDRDQTDLETSLCLLELALDGIALGVGEVDVVAGGENVEIGAGHAQHQVLPGGLKLGQARRGAGFRRVDVVADVGVVQRLDQVQAIAEGLVAVVAGFRVVGFAQ